jgi:glycosyltransferase involved in cell wall biosynthesis
LEPVKVSLIATVLNEGKTLGVWFQSIEKQTRQPDELVIVDAGSTDDTVEQIRRFEQTSKFPVRLQVSPGANIAKGRNIAIDLATHEVIACSDAGCLLHHLWLEKITNPFETIPDTSVVAGWTEPLVKTDFHKAFSELFVPRVNQVDFNRYVPSSRTIAFTKSAWSTAGKYPEWLTLCAEDTFFAIRMRNESKGWVVAPEAIVYWQGRNSWKGVYRQAYGYGFGDGEAGLHSAMYVADIRVLIRLFWYLIFAVVLLGLSVLLPLAQPWGGPAIVILLGLLVLMQRVRLLNRIYSGQAKAPLSHCLRKAGLLYLILIARTIGFTRGVKNRRIVAQKRYADLSGCAVIFSGVPIDDSGGGQRATQLALELLNLNYRVVFLHYYPRYESVDLKIRITHANLEVHNLQDFDVAQFIRTRYKAQTAFAIAEFPHPSFVEPLKQLRSNGVKVIYDLIDDWRTSLGGDWYSLSVEKDYLSFCDSFIASAEMLVSRLRSMGAEQVELVPNAVNRNIFTWMDHERPQDMPRGKYTIIYVGALWGHWFDWDLLLGVARSHAQAAVIVVGDYHGQCPESLPNLHFLGLKAQRDLPPYLANADVAIIPFKNSGLTQAVSPLKVFEYLSMKLPVVSTPLREVQSLPYVITAATIDEFVAAIDSALLIDINSEEIDKFIATNSWSDRIEKILKTIAA